MNPEVVVPLVAILSVFIGAPLAIAYARLIWKRSGEPPHRPSISDDAARQLVHMQQSIDAMAIEIERISEGQRFVTKVLSERRPASALPAGESARSGKVGA
jgi:hypothetical protein